MADKREPKQKTQPKGKDETGRPHSPVDIPVPKRGDIDDLLSRASKPRKKPAKES
jgi:hypothetical protein